jgi:hypothetical protein
MKLHYLIFPLAVIASGCSVTSPVSTLPTAQKTASAICASTGAALQAMVVAGASGALQKIKPEAMVLYPVCNAKTPSGAVTAAESQAYAKIIEVAAPYLGGVK